jgi:hypothetical protein
MRLENPQVSSYQQTFVGRKKQVPVESCKPVQKYSPGLKQKYRTEYSEVFVAQAMAEKKEFGCLSPEQLKSYVMTILTD